MIVGMSSLLRAAYWAAQVPSNKSFHRLRPPLNSDVMLLKIRLEHLYIDKNGGDDRRSTISCDKRPDTIEFHGRR